MIIRCLWIMLRMGAGGSGWTESLDLVIAGYHGLGFVPVEELPTSGILDLADWSNGITHSDDWPCALSEEGDNLLTGDLDGDGDDDIVAANR